MKLLTFLLLFSFTCLGQTNGNVQEEKKYTQKEFDAALKKEVDKKLKEELLKEVEKRIDKIKNNSVANLAKEVIKKEREVDFKMTELERRRRELKILETEISTKFKEFNNQKKEFLGCVEKNHNEKKRRVSQLVKFVSNTPKSSVLIIIGYNLLSLSLL